MSGHTHCQNHTLDVILLHGIDVNGVEVLQQSDYISDHYLVLYKLHIAKAVNSTPYKYGRTITSTTKDCIVSRVGYRNPVPTWHPYLLGMGHDYRIFEYSI